MSFSLLFFVRKFVPGCIVKLWGLIRWVTDILLFGCPVWHWNLPASSDHALLGIYIDPIRMLCERQMVVDIRYLNISDLFHHLPLQPDWSERGCGVSGSRLPNTALWSYWCPDPGSSGLEDHGVHILPACGQGVPVWQAGHQGCVISIFIKWPIRQGRAHTSTNQTVHCCCRWLHLCKWRRGWVTRHTPVGPKYLKRRRWIWNCSLWHDGVCPSKSPLSIKPTLCWLEVLGGSAEVCLC